MYAADFRDDYDDILCYGIAFFKKRCMVRKNKNCTGGPRNMCDVLDKVENKGKAEGKTEGKNQMALLVKKLLDQSRIEDVKRASEDEAYRDKLMKELVIN